MRRRGTHKDQWGGFVMPPGPIHDSPLLPCLKVAYDSAAEAITRSRGQRPYRCNICRAWHTTSRR